MTPLDIMARTVYGEARGESMEGKCAVAWVLRNRADHPSWWGHSLAAVCLAPRQFSAWDDPNRIAMLLADPDTDIALAECIAACQYVMTASVIDDVTGGATHYHTLAVTPKWAAGHTPHITIGNHQFYRGIA